MFDLSRQTRYCRNVLWIFVLILAIMVQSAVAQTIDCATLSYGGDFFQAPTSDCAIILGQPLAGIVTDPQFGYSLELGIVPCLFDYSPPPFLETRTWNLNVSGLWSQPGNWSPEAPPAGPDGEFSVIIGDLAHPQPNVTLDVSPTIRRLELGAAEALLQIDETTAAEITLSLINLGIPNATNAGTVKVSAQQAMPGGDRTLVLRNLILNQAQVSGVGKLHAEGGNLNSCTLRLEDCHVTGGSVFATGILGKVQLQHSFLSDVSVSGVIIEQGTTSFLRNTISTTGSTVLNPSISVAGCLCIDHPVLFTVPPGQQGRLVLDSQLGGGTVIGQGAFLTNGKGHQIEGAGSISVPLTNLGTVTANRNGQILALLGPGVSTNGCDPPDPEECEGQLRAINNGTLQIATQINTALTLVGLIIAQGGAVHIRPGAAVYGDCIDVPPGSEGSVDVDHAELSGKEMRITGGSVRYHTGSLGNIINKTTVCPANADAIAELHVVDSTFRTGLLDICPGGRLEVASVLQVSLGIRNAMTDGTSPPWTWAADSELRLSGGQNADSSPGTLSGWNVLEAASNDTGPSGGVGNFGFAQVSLGTDAHVSLVDFAHNGQSSQSEAVYCTSLNLHSAAVLNLNGLKIFVDGVIVNPGQTIYGGTIVNAIRAYKGDVCGDGTVDGLDVRCFVNVVLGNDSNPWHRAAADMNGDGLANVFDLQQFVAALLGS